MNILIVEDNPITGKLVRFTLEQQGFSVTEASSGEEALSSLDRAPPDLILQDLMLPDMDGFELVERLRARPHGRDVPILALSGFWSSREESRVSAAGFDDVIVKPVEPMRLVQLVKAHLPGRGSGDECFGAGRRLVVVDDDAVQLKLARFRLERLGFEVDTACDGIDALAKLRSRPPAAVLSDIMMPRLDGFGLCLAIRRDPDIAAIPVVLMTNSYIEEADRDLAKRTGGNELVVRTPDMRNVVSALRSALTGNAESAPRPQAADDELQEERMHRVVRQLERQVSLAAGVAQRSSTLAAELCVLSGISEALSLGGDTDAALDKVLAACLDAGGISAGALFLLEDDGRLVVRSSGQLTAISGSPGSYRIDDFFGHARLLKEIVDRGRIVSIPSPDVPGDAGQDVLSRSGAHTILIAPLTGADRSMGALIMLSRDADLNQEDRLAFAQGVAGQIGQALTLARAFADKRASERSAQQHADLLASVLAGIGDGVIVADKGGGFGIWNQAAEAILGRGPTDLPSDRWSEHYGLFLPDKVTPFPSAELPMVRALDGEATDAVELFVRKPDGQSAWTRISSRPLIDGDGCVTAAVSVIRDTTAERAAQAQLMVSDRMASVGLLAAGVAHEINNPLAAVMANLGMAARDCAEIARVGEGGKKLDGVREMLAEALEAADRVKQIVRDLKLFSRSEDERREPLDVRRVLDSSLRMAWTEIRHRAQLVKKYQAVPAVRANESRLGQVFLNLIINAAQCIDEGAADQNRISLATRADAGRVIVEVSDTGPGIAPHVMEHLFTPFFTTKAIGVGTGLGLSICQRLVTSIGGEITVDTELGRGTTFRVSLPATDQPSAAPESVEAPKVLVRRARILLVDDDEAICRAVTRMLSRDHDVVAETLAARALQRISAGDRFDVILCDLMMPVMTGMDLFRELEAVAPEQARRVVFATGGSFTAQAREFLERAPNPKIEKPFDPSELSEIIRSHID